VGNYDDKEDKTYGGRIVPLFKINRSWSTNKCKEIHKNKSNSQINRLRSTNKRKEFHKKYKTHK